MNRITRFFEQPAERPIPLTGDELEAVLFAFEHDDEAKDLSRDGGRATLCRCRNCGCHLGLIVNGRAGIIPGSAAVITRTISLKCRNCAAHQKVSIGA